MEDLPIIWKVFDIRGKKQNIRLDFNNEKIYTKKKKEGNSSDVKLAVVEEWIGITCDFFIFSQCFSVFSSILQ